jgi:hypothetical protein
MIHKGDRIFVGRLDVDGTNREIGKVLDAKIKEMAVKCGFESGTEYAPWDLSYQLEDSIAYFDVKLSCSSSITISERELTFANQVIDKGHTYSIVEFVLADNGEAVFTGVVDIMDLIDEELIKESKYAPRTAYSAQTNNYIRNAVPNYLYESEF